MSGHGAMTFSSNTNFSSEKNVLLAHYCAKPWSRIKIYSVVITVTA